MNATNSSVSTGNPRMKFYCPLVVVTYETESDELIEQDNRLIGYNANVIRKALEDEVLRGETSDMAMHFYGSPALEEKLVSVRWDIEAVAGTVYGCIHVDLTEALTDDEKEELREWIRCQSSDGFGGGFEQRPIDTSIGEVYISFWHSSEKYFLLCDDEFEQHLLTQSKVPKETRKPDCPLIGQDGNVFNLMGIAARMLKQYGQDAAAMAMRARVMDSDSYGAALVIMGAYVNFTSVGGDSDEEFDEDQGMSMK